MSSSKLDRLGLLGGTFNPIHNGHLAIARQTREALSLDRILFIPTNDPPHKPLQSLAPAKDRYEMVRLAIRSDPQLAISDLELRRSGTSYSIDTVRQLQQEYGPQTQLFFLIGLDAFLDFPTWHEPATLLTLCSFIVISRPGLSFQALGTLPLLPTLPQQSLLDLDRGNSSKLSVSMGSHALICLRLPPCDISASEIRSKFKQGLPTANLLPPPVESYILQHHIYD
jgi:nicotinate-nucleotide adenylyltransferase